MYTHDRYAKKPVSRIERRISDVLWRRSSDAVIVPIIARYKGGSVVDVGCGGGAYSRLFLENGCRVTGIDRNPGLCTVDIAVYKEDATRFSRHFTEQKQDLVFSAWLTEYLDPARLAAFFREAYKSMSDGGTFITTNIRDRGWGWLYVNAARRVKRVDKHCYSRPHCTAALRGAGFGDVRVHALSSYLAIPWAELYISRKTP